MKLLNPYTLDTLLSYYPDADEVMLSDRKPAFCARFGRELILNNGEFGVTEFFDSVSNAQERMHQFAADVF